MKTYYITGISGFLGQHVLSEVKKEKDSTVYGLALESDPYISSLIDQGVKVMTGNILNENDVEKFLSQKGEGEKILLHIAGRISTVKRGDKLTRLINYDGTKNVVNIANKFAFSTFLYVSSVDALDPKRHNELVTEQDYFHIDKVKGVYAKSKVEASNYVLENAKMKTIIVCPSAIYGPNDKFNSPINVAIKMFIDGKMPGYVKGGYDVVDVRDVAKGIYDLIEKGEDKNTYILSGHQTTVKNLLVHSGYVVNKKAPKIRIPHFLVHIASPFIEIYSKIRHKKPLFTGFSMYCLTLSSNFSKDKVSKVISYKPRDFDESIKNTIRYYQTIKQ